MLVTRTCPICGKVFERQEYLSRKRANLYCSASCGAKGRWAGHKRSGRKLVRVVDHPLGGPGEHRVFAYRLVLYESIREGPHPCHWCQDPVDWTTGGKGRGCHKGALVVDHLDGDDQNDELDNLVASCNGCNTLRTSIANWESKTNRPIVDLRN